MDPRIRGQQVQIEESSSLREYKIDAEWKQFRICYKGFSGHGEELGTDKSKDNSGNHTHMNHMSTPTSHESLAKVFIANPILGLLTMNIHYLFKIILI